MELHTITHTCGHTSVINDNNLPLSAAGVINPKLRKLAKETHLKNATKEMCPECEAKAIATEIEASGTDLMGTPKQVVWAKEIEKEFWIEFDRKCEGFKVRIEQAISAGKVPDPALFRKLIDNHTKIVTAELLDKRQASWWIDNRNGLAEKMAMTIGKNVQGELTVK